MGSGIQFRKSDTLPLQILTPFISFYHWLSLNPQTLKKQTIPISQIHEIQIFPIRTDVKQQEHHTLQFSVNSQIFVPFLIGNIAI